jgi:hypothetical protein
MEQANLFEILDEEFLDSKFDACFGLRELIERNSTTTPQFNSHDLEIARIVMEALHLGIDLAIIVPRRGLELYQLFERVVAMTILMRSHQQGFDPSASLSEIALSIKEPRTARRLTQYSGEQFFEHLKEQLFVASNDFEQGLLDGLMAIQNGMLDPLDVIRFIGCGGDGSC